MCESTNEGVTSGARAVLKLPALLIHDASALASQAQAAAATATLGRCAHIKGWVIQVGVAQVPMQALYMHLRVALIQGVVHVTPS